MWETVVRFLGREDPLENGWAIYSSILGLSWWLRWSRIHQQCRRPGFDPWVRKIPWRRAWQPTPVLLEEFPRTKKKKKEFPRTEEPGRLQSMGSQRVRHD